MRPWTQYFQFSGPGGAPIIFRSILPSSTYYCFCRSSQATSRTIENRTWGKAYKSRCFPGYSVGVYFDLRCHVRPDLQHASVDPIFQNLYPARRPHDISWGFAMINVLRLLQIQSSSRNITHNRKPNSREIVLEPVFSGGDPLALIAI